MTDKVNPQAGIFVQNDGVVEELRAEIERMLGEIERLRAEKHDAQVRETGAYRAKLIERKLREQAEARLAELEAEFGRRRCANCVALEARLAKVTRDYETLRDAVNSSGECTDPEHGLSRTSRRTSAFL